MRDAAAAVTVSPRPPPPSGGDGTARRAAATAPLLPPPVAADWPPGARDSMLSCGEPPALRRPPGSAGRSARRCGTEAAVSCGSGGRLAAGTAQVSLSRRGSGAGLLGLLDRCCCRCSAASAADTGCPGDPRTSTASPAHGGAGAVLAAGGGPALDGRGLEHSLVAAAMLATLPMRRLSTTSDIFCAAAPVAALLPAARTCEQRVA